MDFRYPEVGLADAPEQPYVAVVGTVSMATFPELADRLPGVIGWVHEHGLTPLGPPFFRYQVIDMPERLVIAAGVPLAEVPVVTGDLVTGTLPGGRFVTSTFVGPPEQLVGVNGALQQWAHEQGLRFDVRDGPDGEEWAGRVEWLETDPRVEPDPRRWQTRVAYRLADG